MTFNLHVITAVITFQKRQFGVPGVWNVHAALNDPPLLGLLNLWWVRRGKQIPALSSWYVH